MRRLRTFAPLACALALPFTTACGSSDETAVDVEASGTSDADAESGASEATTSGDTSDASTSESTTGAEETGTTGAGDEDWARGISVTRVEANPGVGIPLSIDGRESTFDERYARIPARRPMWVFLDVEVEPGWEPREIEARFTLHPAEGDPITASQIVEITRSTSEWKNDPMAGYDSITELRDFGGFYFGLPADMILPGLGWSVSLHEVDPSYTASPPPETAPVLPPADSGDTKWPIGVETSNNVFRLVMVPIAMDYGSCTNTPPYDEANIKRYIDHQFASNPVEEVDYTIHEPYPWNQPISSGNDLSAILNAMSQLKSSEGAGPEVYYYALINNCGICISGSGAGGCIVGMARLPGDGMDSGDSLSRVGSGVVSTSTFVHELGHAQGRSHILCEGAGAAGTDPSYPYDNGTLGSWGFDMREAFLHHPDLGFDYMSYCGPSWVSNWQWEATYRRIATLSSWGDVEPPRERDVLVIEVDEAGETDTWVTTGWVDATRSAKGDEVDFFVGDRLIDSAPARVMETAHSSSYQVLVELPEGEQPDRLELRHAGEARVLPLSSLSAG